MQRDSFSGCSPTRFLNILVHGYCYASPPLFSLKIKAELQEDVCRCVFKAGGLWRWQTTGPSFHPSVQQPPQRRGPLPGSSIPTTIDQAVDSTRQDALQSVRVWRDSSSSFWDLVGTILTFSTQNSCNVMILNRSIKSHRDTVESSFLWPEL